MWYCKRLLWDNILEVFIWLYASLDAELASIFPFPEKWTSYKLRWRRCKIKMSDVRVLLMLDCLYDRNIFPLFCKFTLILYSLLFLIQHNSLNVSDFLGCHACLLQSRYNMLLINKNWSTYIIHLTFNWLRQASSLLQVLTVVTSRPLLWLNSTIFDASVCF
jgi:hypothetical protein